MYHLCNFLNVKKYVDFFYTEENIKLEIRLDANHS